MWDYIKTYLWNFGDSPENTEGRVQYHTYDHGGLYKVTLTLTLDDNTTIETYRGVIVGRGTIHVPGYTIYGHEKWYNDATYVVEGNINIAQGGTLTIDPGVEV